MIRKFVLENCGPLKKVEWEVSPKINLIIGPNGSGKSLLLKMLYVITRATEGYQRGDDVRSFKQILNDKLRGTFQLKHIGDLVRKGSSNHLRCDCKLDGQQIYFSFTRSAGHGVGEISKLVTPRRDAVSLFLPPKEILSLMPIIETSRLQDRLFGFDDSYLDLAIAVKRPPQKGNNYPDLVRARKQLSKLLHGRLAREDKQWIFKEGQVKHPIQITAEGTKRLALVDRLIENRTLTPNSILFVDEAEATLHPRAVAAFMEILYLLSKAGTQVFLASHSYFVLKHLYVIAKRESVNIQTISFIDTSQYTITDLSKEMPDNPIIDASIALYENESLK